MRQSGKLVGPPGHRANPEKKGVGMSFLPVKKVNVAKQVAASIRDAIIEGGLRPGDTLPAERALAGQFKVNRSSVREALHRLEATGLVEIHHGGGTRVTNFLATAGFQIVPFLLAPGGKIDPSILEDLLDLRVALLGWTAERAATRIGSDEVDQLAELVAAMEAETNAARIQELDYDFFELLVISTGNRLLGLIANAVRRVYLHNRGLFDALYNRGTLDTRYHHRLIEAVRDQDALGARVAMEEYGRLALALVSST